MKKFRLIIGNIAQLYREKDRENFFSYCKSNESILVNFFWDFIFPSIPLHAVASFLDLKRLSDTASGVASYTFPTEDGDHFLCEYCSNVLIYLQQSVEDSKTPFIVLEFFMRDDLWFEEALLAPSFRFVRNPETNIPVLYNLEIKLVELWGKEACLAPEEIF